MTRPPPRRSARSDRVLEQFFSPAWCIGHPVLDVLAASPWLDSADHTAHPELHGLSPAQLRTMLEGDWRRRGPLRLNPDLALQELHGAALLGDVRALLEAIGEAGHVPAGADGFEPAFVSAVLDRLPSLAEFADELRAEHGDRIDEAQIRALRVLRQAGHRLRLLRRDRAGYALTPRGRDLMRPERAGALYVLLLRALMLRDDVRDLLLLPVPSEGRYGLVRGYAYPLWALGQVDENWWAPKELAVAIAPPWVWQDDDWAHPWIVGATIELGFLVPLARLGLVEERDLPDDDPCEDGYEIRRAALYHRVVRFDFGPGGPRGPRTRLELLR